MPTALRDVRFQGQSGKHMLTLSFSGFDPGCVETRLSRGRSELFSQLPITSSIYQCDWFPQRRNRDGNSTRKLGVGVFTQPGPLTDNERHEGPRPKPELVQSTRHDQTPFGSRRRAWSGSSLSAHSRNISALLGCFGSSTFWATSAPAIGRLWTASKPTWTRTDA